jgi:hypothetical protein
MNSSRVRIGLMLYFIAGSVYLLMSPKAMLIAQLKRQRPSWVEEMCIRFVGTGRIIFVVFTMAYTFLFIKQDCVGTQ